MNMAVLCKKIEVTINITILYKLFFLKFHPQIHIMMNKEALLALMSICTTMGNPTSGCFSKYINCGKKVQIDGSS